MKKAIVITRTLNILTNPKPIVHSVILLDGKSSDQYERLNVESYAQERCEMEKRSITQLFPEFEDSTFEFSIHDVEERTL